MIAVVTGSRGFIGSHLTDALLASGATVRAVVRAGTPERSRDPRIEYHTMDLLDADAVRDSPVWTGATHVFGVGGVTQARSLEEFRMGNVRPAANILAALAARETPPRFILVSSQAAGGPATSADAPVREADPSRPVEAYGRSKLEAETETLRHAARVPVVVIRPSAVYGPRDTGFLAAFREASGRVAFHAARRDQALSLLHVADVVDGLLLAARHDAAPGRTYFLGSAAPTDWRALYAAIARAAHAAPLQVQIPPLALRALAFGGDIISAASGRSFLLNSHKVALSRPRWWLCDASRARDELGWRPRVDLHDGVPDTYHWYVREGWLRGRKQSVGARTIEEPES
jgi:nucleoside-diphosphate-sugar epimerase